MRVLRGYRRSNKSGLRPTLLIAEAALSGEATLATYPIDGSVEVTADVPVDPDTQKNARHNLENVINKVKDAILLFTHRHASGNRESGSMETDTLETDSASMESLSAKTEEEYTDKDVAEFVRYILSGDVVRTVESRDAVLERVKRAQLMALRLADRTDADSYVQMYILQRYLNHMQSQLNHSSSSQPTNADSGCCDHSH